MRPPIRRRPLSALWAAAPALAAVLIAARVMSAEGRPAGVPPPGDGGYRAASKISDSTWVDHDARPGPQPSEREQSTRAYYFRECLIEPISQIFDVPDKLLSVAGALGAHPGREAVNVNAVDEVPNSTWFSNRNHVRSVPPGELRQGPDSALLPARPWTITHAKRGGASTGFQIKDAAGKKWLVKLDPRGYPQLSSGADMVARTLFHAAGYNVPHNEPARFQRSDLKIDEDLLSGKKGERLSEAGLDSLLARGALFSDSSYSGYASLFLSGHVLGPPTKRGPRSDDPNDWYNHVNRRELRGLYVVCSWIGNWDTKNPNLLDIFVAAPDSVGHVEHYLLDVGSSLGAQATGPKELWRGYERALDFGWIARRLVTLGFAVEPWRRAHQESGIPSVGNFESAVYEPEKFAEFQYPAMREMTDRDGYWGAKIVASFSGAQISAAVDAAHYEDPRAREYLIRCLVERRNKVARHWFGRVAPLDFFSVRDGVLRFHDLAVDVGLESPRGYEVEWESQGGPAASRRHDHLNGAEMALADLDSGATKLWLKLSITGSGARPARVELTRRDSGWIVTRVRHG